MKRDMTGGGVVIATMAALAAVGCPVPVVGLVAAAENSVSGDALRPGDVIRHWGGRTTEVTNTDAEGRLVLADALAYAVAELEPAVVVDVATLTGAIKVALGQQVGGLFANDDALAARPARTPATSRASRCGGSRWPRSTRTRSAAGSPTPTTPAAGRVRSPPRCSSSTSSATSRGRTSTSPRPATRPRTASSGARVRPASAHACCWSGWAATIRSPASGRESRRA